MQREGKQSALPQLPLQFDLAAHGLNDALADRQPQPQPRATSQIKDSPNAATVFTKWRWRASSAV